MKNVNVIMLLGGIGLIILAFIVQVAALGYIGLIVGIIGFIWLAIESNTENKKKEEDLKKSLDDKANLLDKEKTEHKGL